MLHNEKSSLDNRISSAQIVKQNDHNPYVIRFGAAVKLKIAEKNSIQTFQIAGVDEADISKGKMAFTSPLAKVLINKKIGDKAILKRNQKDLVFEIIGITYG